MIKPRFSKTRLEVERDEWNGESIEEKCRRVTSTNEPIEAIAPMIFTERKEGVKPEYDVRTDKWEVAQKAMTAISENHRENRQKRIEKAAEAQAKETNENG